MSQDEFLEVLDDILENGAALPDKVSNRLILAAIRKNYRLSARNSDAIGNIIPAVSKLEEHTERHCKDLEKLDSHSKRGNKFFYFVVFWIISATAVIAWHTGADLGFLPPILPLIP